jgi:hypothetical protein
MPSRANNSRHDMKKRLLIGLLFLALLVLAALGLFIRPRG